MMNDEFFVTWGSEAANGDYDQYVLYLDKETRLIEWLNFTLRERLILPELPLSSPILKPLMVLCRLLRSILLRATQQQADEKCTRIGINGFSLGKRK